MTPTNRAAILTRVNQGLAGAALMTGLTLSGAVASAVPVEWDIEKYDECMRGPGGTVATCCWESGGVVTDDARAARNARPRLLKVSQERRAPRRFYRTRRDRSLPRR